MRQRPMWAAAMTLAMLLPLVATDSRAQGTDASMKLKVGDTAPEFKLQYFDGHDLKDVKLSDYHGKKNVVVAFYIFAFTGG